MKFKKYKLGDLLRVTRGASLAGTGYADEGKYLRLTLANFNEEGGFKEFKSTQGKYFTDTFDRRFLMHKGDLITPLTEQSPGLLGSVAFIPCDNLYIQSQDVGSITCNTEKLDKTFAYYLFLTHSVREQISARSQQTKIRHTSPDKIADVEVFIPDLSTQLRIAGVLGSLDEKIALNRKKIAELEALAKTIYDYWFVQFDFPDKNGKPYKSSGGKMVWNEQLKREVPEWWEVGTVGDYVEIHRGSSPRPIQDYLASEGLRWLKISDASNSSSPFVFHIEDHIRNEGKTNTVLLTAGNLVLSNSASPGIPKFLGVDSCIHDGWLYFPQSRVSKEFLYLFFESSRSSLVPQGNGSVFKNLKTDILRMFPMIKPSDKILEQFDSIATPLFKDIRATVEENLALAEQRDTLLPLLMNGQVEVAG